MTNSILYYPYINIPKTNWTVKSILYWDEVNAIVPTIYRYQPNRLEEYMRELVELELVKQIFPANYILDLPNFDDSFISLTTHNDFNIDEKKINFKNGNFSKLHVQKFGDKLLDELQSMGLAEKESWEWYYVEESTARLFMMYLANIISNIENLTPTTDEIENIDLTLQQNGASLERQNLRGQFIDELLPYPQNPDNIKLKKFKEKHFDKLKKFRNLLELTIISTANISDTEARKEFFNRQLEEIKSEKDEVLSKLNEFNLGQIVFGSIFAITGASISYATENKASGIFALVSAIYSALQGYNRKEALKNEVAYLALMDRRFHQ